MIIVLIARLVLLSIYDYIDNGPHGPLTDMQFGNMAFKIYF